MMHWCVKKFLVKLFGVLEAIIFRYIRPGLENRFQGVWKSFAFFADFDFFPPVFVNNTVANRPVYKPAKGAGLKFPGRALLFLIFVAFINHPARF